MLLRTGIGRVEPRERREGRSHESSPAGRRGAAGVYCGVLPVDHGTYANTGRLLSDYACDDCEQLATLGRRIAAVRDSGHGRSTAFKIIQDVQKKDYCARFADESVQKMIDILQPSSLDPTTTFTRVKEACIEWRREQARKQLCSVGLFRQNNMGRVVRGGVLCALVAEVHRIDAGEEVLAPAEEYGRDNEVDLVDQPGGEVLANGGNSTAESDILAVGRLLRAL